MPIAKAVEKYARNVGSPVKDCKIICPLLALTRHRAGDPGRLAGFKISKISSGRAAFLFRWKTCRAGVSAPSPASGEREAARLSHSLAPIGDEPRHHRLGAATRFAPVTPEWRRY